MISRKKVSPIKVKDYFANPLHQIRQSAFTEVGFNESTLNTFVKCFTNRQNNQYLSIYAINTFIRNFTNNNLKVMRTYEDFFNRFEQNQYGIEVEQFIEFFMKDGKKQLKDFDDEGLKQLYIEMQPVNVENIVEKARNLGITLSKHEAQKIVTLSNKAIGMFHEKQISEKAFITAIQASIKIQ